MTRRRFFEKVTAIMAAGVAGLRWAVVKVRPRRFVRAVPTRRYRGRVARSLSVTRNTKWSG